MIDKKYLPEKQTVSVEWEAIIGIKDTGLWTQVNEIDFQCLLNLNWCS